MTNKVSVCSRHLGDGDEQSAAKLADYWWTVERDPHEIQYKRKAPRLIQVSSHFL